MAKALPTNPTEKDLQREIRHLKTYLKALAVEVTRYTAELDEVMKADESVDRGKCVARITNALNYSADSAMHFGLHMEFSEINKIKRAAEREAPHMPPKNKTNPISTRLGYK
jgi:hypothetical protein